jgi:hypothetical protein
MSPACDVAVRSILSKSDELQRSQRYAIQAHSTKMELRALKEVFHFRGILGAAVFCQRHECAPA